MAKSGFSVFLALFAVVMAVIVVPKAEAITCGDVQNSLIPCLSYVLNGPPLGANCCPGINNLYHQVTTTADRRGVCSCLKGLYSQYQNYVSPDRISRAINLPGSCGVSIPYKISPSIDCNTVN